MFHITAAATSSSPLWLYEEKENFFFCFLRRVRCSSVLRPYILSVVFGCKRTHTHTLNTIVYDMRIYTRDDPSVCAAQCVQI